MNLNLKCIIGISNIVIDKVYKQIQICSAKKKNEQLLNNFAIIELFK